MTEYLYQVRYDQDDKPYVKASVSSKTSRGYYLRNTTASIAECWVPRYLVLIKYNPAEPLGTFFYYYTEQAAVEGRIAELEVIAIHAMSRAVEAKDKISTILSMRLNYGDSLTPGG